MSSNFDGCCASNALESAPFSGAKLSKTDLTDNVGIIFSSTIVIPDNTSLSNFHNRPCKLRRNDSKIHLS